ncbi:VOC family protein [Iocasia frigidifontis]|uniref:VOC family protein n=1 Tax=Iocasia fonsfrigidae TaxID=2682810 RepID=A0A8A7KDG8_9FIRM|nr:VOC family protein [Iocasia fonsfrigidae]QTL97469.1 VOC family protein [Iocasia fonsfrigidae]
MSIKYVHTNIIARDWKKLSQFYINVFDCKPLYPERDLSGKWIDKMTNINNVNIKGIHLRLPGYENGPTLEIFEYKPQKLRNSESEINDQGFGHIAFHVDAVDDVLEKVLQNGGKKLGQIIKKDYSELGILTAVYAQDPEGNFIEIQNWSK